MFPRHSGPSTVALALGGLLALTSGAALAQDAAPVAPAALQTAPADPIVVQPQSPAVAPTSESGAPVQSPATSDGRSQAAQPSSVDTLARSAPAAINSGVQIDTPESTDVAREDLPHNLSPLGMFMAADWVVKSVMTSLAFASLVTWTVWLAKTVQLTGARFRAFRGLRAIAAAPTLAHALSRMEGRGGVVAAMIRAASEEIRLSDAAIDHAGGDGVKERVASGLARIEVRAGRQISKGTGVLATIGSTAPFVGLFGTVWGIMNSFIGISESQTTNLAVVAPGIAEALLATAIGLVAAIPAVIIYNVFARSVTGYRQLLAEAAAGIERLVSRDLDYRRVPRDGQGVLRPIAAE